MSMPASKRPYKSNNKSNNALFASLAVNVLLAAAVLVLVIAMLYPAQRPQSVTSTTTISANQTNGTLAGLNQPFNASQLAAINNEPLNYYEAAGERLLNGTLTNGVYPANAPQYNAIVVNGKPSVVYIGADTCPFCGENRWAMALALARFGNFTELFYGYSALQDGDVPTVFWTPVNATTQSNVAFGAYYQSNSINFIASEYESPLATHFQVQPISYFISKAPNSGYAQVLAFMNSTGKFQGTPFTLWGTSLDQGADAVVIGNSTTGGWGSLAAMTHASVLKQFQGFNDQFAWGEYAAADVYIAQICPSTNNTAAVCKLPAIVKIGALMNLKS